MLDYVQFYTHIWSDKKFRSLTSSDSKILFIYLFSNKNITLTGIYEFDMEECKMKTRLKTKFDESFEELISKDMIKFDAKEELVWIINRFKHISTKSPKVIAGAIEELNRLEHDFKKLFIRKYSDILKPFMFRVTGHEVPREELLTEEFLLNANKLYHSKQSLKNFLMTKGIAEQKLDSLIARVLPGLE